MSHVKRTLAVGTRRSQRTAHERGTPATTCESNTSSDMNGGRELRHERCTPPIVARSRTLPFYCRCLKISLVVERRLEWIKRMFWWERVRRWGMFHLQPSSRREQQ